MAKSKSKTSPLKSNPYDEYMHHPVLLQEALKLLSQAPKMLQQGNAAPNWRNWMRKMQKLTAEIEKVL